MIKKEISLPRKKLKKEEDKRYYFLGFLVKNESSIMEHRIRIHTVVNATHNHQHDDGCVIS